MAVFRLYRKGTCISVFNSKHVPELRVNHLGSHRVVRRSNQVITPFAWFSSSLLARLASDSVLAKPYRISILRLLAQARGHFAKLSSTLATWPFAMPLSSAKDAQIVICGAGCFGLSTAYALLQRGYTNILVLERSDVHPAPDAASTDINKIVRSAYTDPVYCALAREAIGLWKDVSTFGDAYREYVTVALINIQSLAHATLQLQIRRTCPFQRRCCSRQGQVHLRH